MAVDDRGVPHLHGNRARVPPGGGGAPDGALAQAGGGRGEGPADDGAATRRWRYLVEQEPNFLRLLEKQTGLELEVRDDPMMRLDEFRMMAQPAGRDVTEQYAVA